MEKDIEVFVEEQKSLTFCTSIDNIPYCANCFYAYRQDGNYLIFKSSRKTQHIVNALINDKVAGTIIPDINKLGTIKGIQFVGRFIVPIAEELEEVKKIYYRKHPFALPMKGEIWMVALTSVKMTDNTLGFGKKFIWKKKLTA